MIKDVILEKGYNPQEKKKLSRESRISVSRLNARAFEAINNQHSLSGPASTIGDPSMHGGQLGAIRRGRRRGVAGKDGLKRPGLAP
jgi:hypothetical protein